MDLTKEFLPGYTILASVKKKLEEKTLLHCKIFSSSLHENWTK